jgi:hypothetical protein
VSRPPSTAAPPPAIACTLAPGQLPTQLERWASLYAEAGIERRGIDDGLRVSFRPGPAVEQELRALVAVEAECCRWASWRVHTRAGALVLEITSTAEGVPVIHNWLLDQPAKSSTSGQRTRMGSSPS